MADYTQPPDVERRVRFFDGQYLQEQDFIDEQKYHIDRQRRHNRLLHVAGVADGLMVSKKGAAQVTVSAGTAIDSDGRQLVLLADPQTVVDFPSALKGKSVCLYVLYKEDPVDLQKQAGSEDNRRWLEKPDIKAVAKGEVLKFDYPPVLLAELALDPTGAITGEINNAVRDYSGLRLPGSGTDAPVLRTAAGNLVNLQGGLTVTGKVGIGTTGPGAMLEVANYTLDNTAFQPLIRLLAHQKDESSSNVFDESKPSYGIEFYRRWSNTITNIQAGIYAWATGNVGSGLAFRTKPSTGSGARLPTRMVITDGGNVGIGATDPKSTLSVKGALAVGANYAGTNAAPDNGLLVEGTVGIGTTSPRGRLEVSGPTQAGTGTITSSGTTVTRSGTSLQPQLRVGDYITASGQTRTITAITSDTVLTIDTAFAQNLAAGTAFTFSPLGLLVNNGNVGIGTTTPKAFQVVLPETSKGGTAPGAGVTIAGGEHASIELRGTGTPYIDFAKDAATTDYHARIRLTATDKLAIEGAKVGIGTTEPKSALSVKGGLAVGTNYAGTNAAPDNELLVEGNVGIGTTNPIMAIAGYQKNWKGLHSVSDTDNGLGIIEGKKLARVHLRAADNTKDKTQDFIIQNFNNSLQFSWLGGSLGDRIKALAIDEDGSVGIGMTNPGAALDISGKANTDKQISLQLRSGNQAFNYESNQITLGYNNTAQYRHAIKTRHHGGQTAGNAIDFYVWQYGTESGAADRIGGLHTMTLDGGNVGIGATGPEAKLDVNGDMIVSGVIKGRFTNIKKPDKVFRFVNPLPFTFPTTDIQGMFSNLVKQKAAIVQGFSITSTASVEAGNLFAIGQFGIGDVEMPTILDITSGATKTFIIDHPLHQDKYLMHATLEGPEGAVYYRGTARLDNGRAQIQLPDYFEALARAEGRTILLSNIDGFDPLAVLTQDGAKIKDGRFIVVSSNKESNQVCDWEVKAIRKDAQALEVEPLKSAIKVERFGPYAYAVPANADRMRAQPLHAHPNIAGPQAGTGDIPGACGPLSKITNIR